MEYPLFTPPSLLISLPFSLSWFDSDLGPPFIPVRWLSCKAVSQTHTNLPLTGFHCFPRKYWICHIPPFLKVPSSTMCSAAHTHKVVLFKQWLWPKARYFAYQELQHSIWFAAVHLLGGLWMHNREQVTLKNHPQLFTCRLRSSRLWGPSAIRASLGYCSSLFDKVEVSPIPTFLSHIICLCANKGLDLAKSSPTKPPHLSQTSFIHLGKQIY